MSRWPSVPLPDIADMCLGKMLDKKKNKGNLRPYLANINVRWGTLDLKDLREMPFEDRELDRYGLKAGDIIMCEGGEPGRCVLWTDQVPGMMVQKALHRIRPKDTVDSRFLYYSLFFKGRTGGLEPYFTGATIKHLPGEQLAKVCVTLPPLDTQRRIASILGAYDDLIEVNRLRVAVLEEMARGLFEEWFVRFRFPGHESVPLVDTPDGPLPQEWSFAPLEEFLVLQRGFDLPKSKRGEGAVPVFSASGFHGGHSEAKVAAPGVVTGRSGTIGQVHLVMEDYWPLNTTLYVREFRRAAPAYALLLLRRLDLAQHASGAAVPTLNRNHIHGVKLPAAPQPLIDRFEQFAFANFQSIRSIEQANERLASSRDLLLPRLISGQLSVEAAERNLELAA